MRISVAVLGSDTTVSKDFIPLEVFPDMSLDDVKGFIEEEINIPPSAQQFAINEQIITHTSRSLTDIGVNDGDVIGLLIRTRPQDAGARTQGQQQPQTTPQRQTQESDTEMLRLQVLGNDQLRRQVQREFPELIEVLDNPQEFAKRFDQKRKQQEAAMREKEEMLAQLEQDPMNEEAQRKIEEIIRNEQVSLNMNKALEENPESFGYVNMLYVDVLVNNVPIKAFVDSGAQTTIMSPDAAERCNIMRLIDRRFSGVARGVGTAQILGRVHSAEMQLGQYNLATSFTVMEGKDVDLLLGLDMLKRHQMCIDLRENCLKVGNDTIPFLPESEIPRMMQAINEKEQDIKGPAGLKIGSETGTVKPATPTPAASSSSSSAPQSSSSRINIHPVGSAGHVSAQRGPTAPTTAAPQPQRMGGAFNTPSPVTEQAIATMVDMGFDRQASIQALQQAGGNVELAISLLSFD